MNVTAHQEMEKNEKTKTGKRRAGKEKNMPPIFKKLFCSSAVIQGEAQQKNERECLGEIGTLGKANSHFDPTQTGSGTASPH